MDTLVSLLIRITTAIAVYVLAIRIISAYVTPTRLSNRILGKSIGLVMSVIGAEVYLLLTEQFIAFPEPFRLVLFVAFLIGNCIVASSIFSERNEGRITYYAKPKTTRPNQRVQRYRRPREENFQDKKTQGYPQH